MRKQFLLILILLAGLIFIILWLAHKSSQIILQSSINAPTSRASSSNSIAQTLQKRPSQNQVAVVSKSGVSNDEVEFVQKTMQDSTYEWKQPVNFYGKVLDENDIPVAGAAVNFDCNDLSTTGTSRYSTISDNGGSFSLQGKKGKYLYVMVSKEGYYSSGNSKGSAYEYADPANKHNPDSSNPVIFHLRKKGNGADLITSQARIVSPTNGTPVFFDFLNHQIGNSGQLEIEGWKEHKNRMTGQNSWGLRLTILDGGFVEENDEFSFKAPDANYQSVVEWHFIDGSTDWQGGIIKNFYIKFGNPAHYGKITIDTTAFYPSTRLEYTINPDGSRNLEPK